MKKRVAIYYPPTLKNGQYPLLGQNRQFKFTSSKEIRIFPLLTSSLATMLKKSGNEVIFLDGINLRYDFEKCGLLLDEFKPEIIVMETKAPLFSVHLEVAAALKARYGAKIIFCGDHVSFFPEETLKAEAVDYAAVSGYYDFIIAEFVEFLEGTRKEMPAGIYYKENGTVKGSKEIAEYELDKAPFIDRDLTSWDKYGEAYLYKPAAYILSGRGCGGASTLPDGLNSEKPGKCAFCIWQHALWSRKAKLRSAANFAEEIEILVKKYKVKEIFDDNESGGTWHGEWLKEFYGELKKRGLLGKFFISSNARADSLTEERCTLLKKIGYRLLKIGLESANDKTLKIIQKDEEFSVIEKGIKTAKRHGLVVLMTTLVGYPWETEAEADLTIKAATRLLLYKTHFGDSLQSSIILPYPGTPLFNYAEKNGYLTANADDFTLYDMEHDILRRNFDNAAWCKKMWKIHLHPLFMFKSFITLRRYQDIKLAFTGLVSLIGHLKDYGD